jgi:NADH-quinone oxidoreductase subunit N
LWRVLAFVAIITCTFGNLAAYGQTNIKRLLAYSTIAQAGYMIMPVPAAMVLAGSDPDAARAAIASMAFYAGVYLFMNLGAFAVVALLRNELHSEQIADYAGLVRRSPIIVVCFSIMLISLIGLPPLAGFAGKLLIFYSLVQAKLWTVLVVAGLNTALSLYYYLRVVKIMTIDPEPEQTRPAAISFIPGTYIVAVTVPVVLLGLAWNQLNELSLAASAHLF